MPNLFPNDYSNKKTFWIASLLCFIAITVITAVDIKAMEIENEGNDLASFGHPVPFSIVILPDTQLYSDVDPAYFIAQTEWIRDNKEKYNVKFVIHVGDITKHNSRREWENADMAMSVLDGVIPYSVVSGNHDMGKGGEAEVRDTKLYNTYFAPERFKKQEWYGGSMGETNDNNYCFFEAGGIEFMVLSLEFGPRDSTLEWANRIVTRYKEKKVIVVTHCYLYYDNRRVSKIHQHEWSPHTYGIHNNNNAADGEQIWERFVKWHPNLFLVLSGHIPGDGTAVLTSKGVKGNTVHQMLVNYETSEDKKGCLRVLRFVPSENKVYVEDYNPLQESYHTTGYFQPGDIFE